MFICMCSGMLGGEPYDPGLLKLEALSWEIALGGGGGIMRVSEDFAFGIVRGEFEATFRPSWWGVGCGGWGCEAKRREGCC